MAPELRTRKSKPTLKEAAPAAKKEKKGSVEKRKANDDASPIAPKKQKGVKGQSVESPAPKKGKKKVVEEKEKEEATPKTAAAKKEKTAKKSKNEVAPEPEDPEQEAEAAANEDDQADEEEVDATTQALVETLDEGAEDDMQDEQTSTYKKGQDVGKVPQLKKAAKAAKTANGVKGSGNKGVIYLGSIPHGFYEHEIKEYFSQFGEITRLRVVRSKKTGASKHRAFIEFADAEVADIAARTMDSYLLFGHILRAKVVEPSQVHPELFKGSNRRFKAVPWNGMIGRHLERPLGETKWQGKISKEEKRRSARADKLKALGYEFEAPELKAPKAQEVIEAPAEEAPKAVEAPSAAEEAQVEETKEKVVEKVEEPTSISQAKPKKGKKGKKVKA